MVMVLPRPLGELNLDRNLAIRSHAMIYVRALGYASYDEVIDYVTEKVQAAGRAVVHKQIADMVSTGVFVGVVVHDEPLPHPRSKVSAKTYFCPSPQYDISDEPVILRGGTKPRFSRGAR